MGYFAGVFSLCLFLAGLWDYTHTHITCMRDNLEEHIATVTIALALDNLSRSVKALASLSRKSPIVKEYLAWLVLRHKNSLELPFEGIIQALDPDYFGFAGLIFRHASFNVACTSKVDPLWYRSEHCEVYIKGQVEEIAKRKVYTRYFIVDPKKDTKDRMENTVSVIQDQARKGFVIFVVHTENYDSEHDVAMIDDGTMCVEATVESQGSLKLPVPGITGCKCYFKEDDRHKNEFNAIKGYFMLLNRRIFARFDNSTAALATIETVYGTSKPLQNQPSVVSATHQGDADNLKLKFLAFCRRLLRFVRGGFIS